ncbi:hypothetical protein NDU88_001838 [Pleurodeles waltl]|uniref:Uncharacterized protein n=1 Tax=Pleurodeles waltl TaxID=8319 RepID=A0AAV7LYT7_PLEWA|nr:hypothetical protein NDU88_001838 [Pleurodeles waltl]
MIRSTALLTQQEPTLILLALQFKLVTDPWLLVHELEVSQKEDYGSRANVLHPSAPRTPAGATNNCGLSYNLMQE